MQHRLDAVEDGLVGVRHHELMPPAITLSRVDPEEPRELSVGEQCAGQPGARPAGEDAVVAPDEVEQPVDLGGEVQRKLGVLRVVLGVSVPVIAEQLREDLAAVGERVANRWASDDQVGVRQFRNHVEQVDRRACELGIGDPPRHRDADTGASSPVRTFVTRPPRSRVKRLWPAVTRTCRPDRSVIP